MFPLIPVSIGIFIRNIKTTGVELWMQKRAEKGPLNGLWEFPGGKIEAGESPNVAVIREIKEEVNLDISSLTKIKLFKLYPYTYLDRSICLYSFIIMIEEVEKNDLEFQSGRWFSLNFQEKSSPLKGTIPEVNHLIIDELLEYLKLHQDQKLLENLWMQ